MFHKYVLQPKLGLGFDVIEFKWNPETGALSGKDAAIVEGLIDEAMEAGYVTGPPNSSKYPLFNPHQRPRDMALVLGQYFVLPEGLAEPYPALSYEDPWQKGA
jgi:hypothetical protein